MEPNNEKGPIISEEEMKMPEDTFGSNGNMGESDKSTQLGVILGILIVILVLILGGLYLWGTTIQKVSDELVAPSAETSTTEENDGSENTNEAANVETVGTLSTSNELEAIEADIESTNLDQLDAELDTIDAELDASLDSQ